MKTVYSTTNKFSGRGYNYFENSVNPDVMARNEPSHLYLHCLSFYSGFKVDFPVCINGYE